VTNAFHPGAMPFQIVSTFPGVGEVAGIQQVNNSQMTVDKCYNLAGQRTTGSYKGIIIKGGKKYYQR
jgi:hypothetical protein